MTTIVDWVLDASGNYEVSSPEHLIQIMNHGSIYTNTGSVPTNYVSSAAIYLQTVDIDLSNYHEHIVPIGGDPTFQGVYDGGGYSISNWSYNSGAETTEYSGLFGRLQTNGTIKRLKLTGVWKNIGSATYKGLLCAYMIHANCSIHDVVTDFESGTILSGDSQSLLGVICGLCKGHISGCVLRGSISFSGRADNMGCITGALDSSGSLTYCANYGNYGDGWGFGNTNTTGNVGGIIGRCHWGFSNLHNVINGMTGDLVGGCIGGILGAYQYTSILPTRADTLLNCMVGDIVGTRSAWYVGGIFGDVWEWGDKIPTFSKLVNVMSGSFRTDLSYPPQTGGLIGRAHNNGSTTFTLSNSLVAMSGNVEDTVVAVVTNTEQMSISATVDTTFGLTFDTNTYATTDPLVEYLTDDTFTICPYLEMSGTNSFGDMVEFDPSFANLSGLDAASPYAQYTTLTIHTSPKISFPIKTEFTFADTNTTKYYSYSKRGLANTDLYIDDTLTVASSIADALFHHSTGTLISGLLWTQNESGDYEISSAKHLVQLMTKGSVFTDTGSFPTDYRTGTYVQTADCDLQVFSKAISPIGDTSEPFVGDYIGGGFSISNWSYGEGISGDGVGVKIGLFGEVQGTVSNLKLCGKWDLGASTCEQSGFLVAKLSSGSVYDIDAVFETGTSIWPTTGTTHHCTMGVLIGETYGNVTGIRLSGDVTFPGKASTIGGVIGETLSGSSISWIHNSATFNRTGDGFGKSNSVNAAILDNLAGGIVGCISEGTVSAFNLYNTMVGDVGGEFAGGIVGRLHTDTMTRSDTWVNCMQGNISGLSSAANGISCGGIVGDFKTTGTSTPVLTKMVNYMFGDINGSSSGGIFGQISNGSGGNAPDVQCNNSVIAMNGFTKDSVVGLVGDSVDMAVTVNEDFGLTFNTNTHTTTDPLTGYLKHVDFDLPYLSMAGGELGVANDFEIIFVNLGGVAETSPFYTRECLIVHTSPEIVFPYKTVFDIPEDNATQYLTYGKLSSPTLYIDSSSLNVVSTDALHTLSYDGSLLSGTYPPISVSVINNESKARKQYHSLTEYSDTHAIGTLADTRAGYWTKAAVLVSPSNLGVGFLTASGQVSLTALYCKGMHYNPVTDTVYYVDSQTGTFRSFLLNGYVSRTTISSEGTYHTLQGDGSNVYIFGAKVSPGGDQQIFRVDADGTNEITVNTSTILPGNYVASGFAINRDDQKVYFHDETTFVVRSLGWDLTGLETLQTLNGDLKVQAQHSGSLCYARGYVYFGSIDPQTGAQNDKFYQYDLSDGGTRELIGVNDHMRLSSGGPTNDLYIDPHQNTLVISGYNEVWVVKGDSFDFYHKFCSVTRQYYDGWAVAWDAVEGATSYQLVVNDVVVGTTTDLSLETRGHADNTLLNIAILSSTDDVTYTGVRYYSTQAIVKNKFVTTVEPENFTFVREGGGDWVDPYNPGEAILPHNNGLYMHNFHDGTMVYYPNSYAITILRRSFRTTAVIGLANNKLFSLGRGATDLIDGKALTEIYNHPSQIQSFHCSFSGLIYFTVKTSNEVWTVEENGTDAQLLFTLNGTATTVATDPHHPNTLVYGDGNDLMYRDLSTGDSRVVFAGAKMDLNNRLIVIDNIIYTCYRWQTEGYLRVNIDGVSDFELDTRSWGFGMLVDTVNQEVYVLDVYGYDIHVDRGFTIASLPPDPSKTSVTVNPLGFVATWIPIPNATVYRVGVSQGEDGENTIITRYTTSDNLRYKHNATSGSTLSVYVYYDTPTTNNILDAVRTITIPDYSTSAEDFDKGFFENDSGDFDISDISVVSAVLNELFDSGDNLQVSLPSGKKMKTKFVKRGENVEISSDAAIAIPFSQDAGSGQAVSLTLSDSSTLAISFDETTEEITVGGTAYASGESFIVDGKKVTLVDI